jgi:hypothetical protein
MAPRTVTVNELLDGRVALDIECLDRIYLNAYVPILQSSGQVVAFLTRHLGYPFPSPALFNKIGQWFRAAVAAYADAEDIPVVRFGKDDRKLAVMTPHLSRQARTGHSGVAAIGVSQARIRRDRLPWHRSTLSTVDAMVVAPSLGDRCVGRGVRLGWPGRWRVGAAGLPAETGPW